MTDDRFQSLLKETIGLDANSIGASAVHRAVTSRARECGIEDLGAYWNHISSDTAELQALIETVVVPETWFFRDREAFAAAVTLLRAKWQSRPAELPLRLLSLPCSTGEEPYTMAMALLDAGTPQSAIRIDAVDISQKSLNRARAGLYGRNSFRGSDLEYRARHFAGNGHDYRISNGVKSVVHFSQGNIFELNHLNDASYDVVFCRNLLIYFDAEDQRRATSVLERLLSVTGTLFVGHSEASILMNAGFTSLRLPQAFAFQKNGNAPIQKAQAKLATIKITEQPPKRKSFAPPPPAKLRDRATPIKSHPIAPPPLSAQPTSLDDIKRAADRGDLKDALQLGAAFLKTQQPSAEVLYLLAVISEAAGESAAATDYYRKTLYLEPNHDEAIAHLTLLLKRNGDTVGASRFSERARRLDERKRAQ